MGYISRHRVDLAVTTTGGAAQTFFSDVINGLVQQINYRPGPATANPTTANAISTAATITISGENSRFNIIVATATDTVTWFPRAAANTTAFGIFGGATGAGAAVGIPERIAVAGERVKVVVASAGAASAVVGGRKGVVDLYIEGP